MLYYTQYAYAVSDFSAHFVYYLNFPYWQFSRWQSLKFSGAGLTGTAMLEFIEAVSFDSKLLLRNYLWYYGIMVEALCVYQTSEKQHWKQCLNFIYQSYWTFII